MTRLLVRLFSLLLRALPGDLRREHGAAMVADLADSMGAEGGRIGVVRVWFTAVVDLIRRAGYEHWLRRERRRRRVGLIAGLPAEVRLAVRGYLRQPMTTGLLVGTLALGMAAALGVFGLIHAVVLRPLPFPRPERLVYLNETAPRWNLTYTGINYPDFHQWRGGSSAAFEAMGVYGTGGVNLADPTGSERARAAWVSYDLIDALGIRPVLGRRFDGEDDRFQGPPVLMLGEALWRNRFGGRPDVVGQTVLVNGTRRTIIGVLPREASFLGESQLWLPLQGNPSPGNSQSYSYEGIGRLRPGVDLAEAHTALTAAHAPIWAAGDTARVVSPVAVALRDFLSADYRSTAAALAVGAGLLLLCAVANVASTMLARALFRRREVAVRVALGAAPAQVARQLVVESLVLATAGAGLGLVIGQWGLGLFARAMGDTLPPWIQLTPTWATVLAALSTVGLSGFVLGLAPIRFARQHDPAEAFGSTRSTQGLPRAHRRLLHGFVIAEVALATTLLGAGGMLARGYHRVRAIDPGLDASGLVTFRVALTEAGYPDSTAAAGFRSRLADELAATPGVRGIAVSTCLPLAGCHNGNFFEVEGAAPLPAGSSNPVTLTLGISVGGIEALGFRVTRGRAFQSGDGDRGPTPVLVSEDFANLHWPGLTDPTGRRIRFSGGDSASWRTVVGVVANVRHYGLDRPTRPTVYLPFGRANGILDDRGLAVAIRADGSVAAATEAARAVVRRLDPSLPLFAVRTMDEAVARSLALRRVLGAVLAFFAVASFALAAGGLYGVLTYLVGRRRSEIGLRLALGARPGQVVALVVRHGLVLAATGLGLGTLAVLGIGRLVGAALPGVHSREPWIMVGVIAVMVLVAAVAAAIPGWQAARLPPRASLTAE